jgi:hypothetical protein
MNGKGAGLGSLSKHEGTDTDIRDHIRKLGHWVSEKKASISAPRPSEPDMKGAERMYVAIRQYGLLTNEPVENVFQGVREGFIPIIKNAPGFLAYYVLDSGSGTLTSISIFEHRAGAERSNKLAEDWVGRTLSSVLPTSPEIIVGEVGAHELNLIKLGIREVID